MKTLDEILDALRGLKLPAVVIPTGISPTTRSARGDCNCNCDCVCQCKCGSDCDCNCDCDCQCKCDCNDCDCQCDCEEGASIRPRPELRERIEARRAELRELTRRRDAVSLALRSNVQTVAADFGIDAEQLGKWRDVYLQHGPVGLRMLLGSER